MYGYVYKITNLINGKIYVGKHKSVKWDNSYFGSGRIMKNVITKYGKTNLKAEILQEASNEAELNKLEKYWINALHARDLATGYNIAEGGNDGNSGLKWCNNGSIEMQYREKLPEGFHKGRLPMSDQQRESLRRPRSELSKKRASDTKKGYTPINNTIEIKWVLPEKLDEYLSQGYQKGYGGLRKSHGPHSPETRKKISDSNKGKSPSEETRKKISAAVRRTTSSPEWIAARRARGPAIGTRGKCWYNNGSVEAYFKEDQQPEAWARGRLPLSAETKAKLSKAITGRTVSEVTRQRMREAQARNKDKRVYARSKTARKILCIETQQMFNSYMEVTAITGLAFSTIKHSIKTGDPVGHNKYDKEKWTFKLWED